MWIQAALIVGAVIAGNIITLLALGHRTPAKWAAAAYLKIKEESAKIQARRDQRRTHAMLGFFLVLAVASSAQAQKYATSENLVVSAPTQDDAQQILTLAERYKQELADEWLGGKVPGEKIVLHMDPRVIPCCRPSRTGSYLIWIQNRHQLKHELAHALLHPLGIPHWASEGIASQYDDYPSTTRRTVSHLIETKGRQGFLRELINAH